LGYKRNVSLKRIVSHLIFALNLKREIKKVNKPDLIYVSYPTISAAFFSGKYSKRNNIPMILDVQDVWPESISSAINTNIFFVKLVLKPITNLANRVYTMPDLIFGVSETYVNRAKVRGTKCKEFITVYIGSDFEKIKYENNNDFKTIEKGKNDIWITYVGTLSYSYDIDTAIKAFSELKDFKNLKFIILGSGPDEERLVHLSKELGVFNENVFFMGYIKYSEMFRYLLMSDIALNAITKYARQTITNKFGDYLTAGLPILNSCQEPEVIDIINKHELGLNYIPHNVDSLINAIFNIVNSKEKLKLFSLNSKQFASEKFNRKISYNIIINKINELIDSNNKF